MLSSRAGSQESRNCETPLVLPMKMMSNSAVPISGHIFSSHSLHVSNNHTSTSVSDGGCRVDVQRIRHQVTENSDNFI